MAAPIIVLSLESALTGTVDLTALTGGDVGFTKADYMLDRGVGLVLHKYNGPDCLRMSDFGTAGSIGAYFWSGVSATMTDKLDVNLDKESATVSDTKSRDYDAQVSSGIQYASVDADQDLRTFHWQGITNGGGYRAVATLADGSYAAQTLSLPADGDGSFKCVYRGRDPASSISIQIEKIGTTSGNILARFVYLEVPVPRPRAKGLNMFYRSVYR